MGSDYPWVPWKAVELVKGARNLSRETKNRILWKNASRLLKLRL
jgi:predicted TIM-barrel fold metal-dependent hydrolase